jgi:DNA polymerase-3 subunit gamma/tau
LVEEPTAQKTERSAPLRTPTLKNLFSNGKTGMNPEDQQLEPVLNESFTVEQLKEAWAAFAETRKKFQAEFQLLNQPFDFHDKKITIHLLNPVQESILSGLRTELGMFLKETLKNSTLQIEGVAREENDTNRVIYTPREKFEYLIEKNPILQEMKDRLGLDTDF